MPQANAKEAGIRERCAEALTAFDPVSVAAAEAALGEAVAVDGTVVGASKAAEKKPKTSRSQRRRVKKEASRVCIATRHLPSVWFSRACVCWAGRGGSLSLSLLRPCKVGGELVPHGGLLCAGGAGQGTGCGTGKSSLLFCGSGTAHLLQILVKRKTTNCRFGRQQLMYKNVTVKVEWILR